jgi:predicted ATP-grasp superfamily ATP-dependent carboligase
MSHKYSVLIPDGNKHTLLYVANSFSKVKGVKLYTMAFDKRSAMKFSRYIYNYSYYKKPETDLEWVNNINTEIEKHDIDLIMPVFEEGIRILIEHKTHLKHPNKLCVLPNLKDFLIANNKGKLYNHLEKNNFNKPNSIIVENNIQTNLNALLNKIKFPVVVKPVEGYGGGLKVALYKDKKSCIDFFENTELDCNYIVQEYINGYDGGCSVLCKEGVVLHYTMQKAIMKGGNNFAPLVALKFFYDEKLLEQIKRLMKSLNWSGVCHIDVRYDDFDKTYKILEINARFWSSLEASTLAGTNFPDLYASLSLGKTLETQAYSKIKFYNLKGLIKGLKQRKKELFNINFILNNTPMGFALKDPLPMVYKFISRTIVIIMKKQ